MSNVVRQGVEGIGISLNLPHLCQNSLFTQVAIPETVKIPDVKPDMEELLSVMVEAKIVSLRIINTPKGTSQEGQTLTGKKLSIELELNQKVKYIADEPTQSVHSAHFTKKVTSIWIVVPETVKDKNGRDVKIETLLAQGKLLVTPYIEDIYGEQLDKRTIFKNIIVLINVTLDCCYGEANIILTKTAPATTTNGTTFTYTLTIENKGSAVATKVLLQDTAGGPVAYADNFKINGVLVPNANPFQGSPIRPINIGDIPPCTTIKVTYDVRATGTGAITNDASITYNVNPCSTTTKTVSAATSTTVS